MGWLFAAFVLITGVFLVALFFAVGHFIGAYTGAVLDVGDNDDPEQELPDLEEWVHYNGIGFFDLMKRMLRACAYEEDVELAGQVFSVDACLGTFVPTGIEKLSFSGLIDREFALYLEYLTDEQLKDLACSFAGEDFAIITVDSGTLDPWNYACPVSKLMSLIDAELSSRHFKLSVDPPQTEPAPTPCLEPVHSET